MKAQAKYYEVDHESLVLITLGVVKAQASLRFRKERI